MVEGPFFVTFNVGRQPRRVSTPDHENWKLEMLKDGFWITQQFVPCQESQGHYWIPPSQVILIEKINQPPEVRQL
jgi:hypothetical protein